MGNRLCILWGKGERGSHLSHLGGRGGGGPRPAILDIYRYLRYSLVMD
jgi:hypothetical protein